MAVLGVGGRTGVSRYLASHQKYTLDGIWRDNEVRLYSHDLWHHKTLSPWGDKCKWGGVKLATFDEKLAITQKRYKIDA